MEFSNYESDQSALYSGEHHLDANSADSKAKVKNIIKVTAILTVVTIVEVGLGLYGTHVGMPKWLINSFFIVKIFMHLGDEIKNMILTILIPLALFFWFIIAFLWDGSFWLWINHAFGIR